MEELIKQSKLEMLNKCVKRITEMEIPIGFQFELIGMVVAIATEECEESDA